MRQNHAVNENPGVFCLEGEWEDDLWDPSTIRPLLEVMRTAGQTEFVHRRVATKADFRARIEWWLGFGGGLEVLYLSAHGSKATLCLGGEDMTLGELSAMLDERAQGSVIYFGGCTVLAGSEDDARRFCRDTGVRAVVGYTRQVDWLQGASFELVLLPDLAWTKQMPQLFKRMISAFPVVTARSGFRVATSTWSDTAK